MTNTLAHQKIFRNMIGVEPLFDWMEKFGHSINDTFPPYNTIKTGENEFLVEIAVAGFSIDELSVVVEGPIMKVIGKHVKSDEKRTFLHQGIARRNFERVWRLGERVKVVGTTLRDGILQIELKREVPEELKPIKFEIQAA